MHPDQPETRYVTVGNVDVAYQVIGDGPIDLVFHHGFCHLDLQWDVAAESAFNRRLATFSRLILFDRRGVGASERLARGVIPTLDQWSDDLLAVLDEVGSDRPAIFAESDAGAMAIRFAVRYPDRLSALVLANTQARYAWAEDYQLGMSAAEIEQRVQRVGDGWGQPEFIAGVIPGLARQQADLLSLARLCRAAATPGMASASFRRTYEEVDVRNDLVDVRVPTLVLDAGAEFSGRARYLAEHIRGATLATVPGEGLYLFGTEFEIALSEVAGFLTGRRLEPAPVRQLVTVLFTDIVSSTERLSLVGDGEWRTILDSHDNAVRREVQRFGGREVNTTGDGFLVSFNTPGNAIQCADRILTALEAIGIDARVGIHAGECEARGNDLAGMAIHIAARVAGEADAGEVLVSRTIADLVLGSGVEFGEPCEHDLKGVPGPPWALFSVKRGA